MFSFLANKNAVAETPRHIISIYLHSYFMFSEVIPVRYLFSINMSLKINICFTSLSFLFVDPCNKTSIWKMIYSVKHFFPPRGRFFCHACVYHPSSRYNCTHILNDTNITILTYLPKSIPLLRFAPKTNLFKVIYRNTFHFQHIRNVI